MFRVVSTLGMLLWLACLPLVAGQFHWARRRGTEEQSRSHARLLSRSQGLAIANAARKYESRTRRNVDCSHLVHEIYERVGFAYPYASSSKLYAGVEGFRRVKAPQAGDLIVWRGHVGIVVDPGRHSFYSSRGSGPGIDFYDSRYWMGRGRPRLYRYTLPKRSRYST